MTPRSQIVERKPINGILNYLPNQSSGPLPRAKMFAACNILFVDSRCAKAALIGDVSRVRISGCFEPLARFSRLPTHASRSCKQVVVILQDRFVLLQPQTTDGAEGS